MVIVAVVVEADSKSELTDALRSSRDRCAGRAVHAGAGAETNTQRGPACARPLRCIAEERWTKEMNSGRWGD